ncbi:relaxase domain-containing protein [Streptomyces sp. NPDC058701]|uniref:relaxase domain-containing protein n=1 Tax=Streptomyces sp. NPDC058701 TaxID=3346608 RepID=UPI00364C404F
MLHEHLLLSVKGQRLDGKWGSTHTTALHGNTVATSALYNELVAAEVCEVLGLATEPRTDTAGRRPVMEIAGVPNELIRWISRRSDQIAACLAALEHEYVTAVEDDCELKFLPVVSERSRRQAEPPHTGGTSYLSLPGRYSAVLSISASAARTRGPDSALCRGVTGSCGPWPRRRRSALMTGDHTDGKRSSLVKDRSNGAVGRELRGHGPADGCHLSRGLYSRGAGLPGARVMEWLLLHGMALFRDPIGVAIKHRFPPWVAVGFPRLMAPSRAAHIPARCAFWLLCWRGRVCVIASRPRSGRAGRV